LSFEAQGSGQGPRQGHKPRWNEHSFKPGQSGNPLGGAIRKIRTEAQHARKAELRAAVASEFTDKLTTLETVLVDQAAEALELAERASDNARVRLVRLALSLMERIRRQREASKPKAKQRSMSDIEKELRAHG
jgi:hypothetical protein